MKAIYQIKNTETGRVYIGQTVNFDKRQYHHIYTLKAGTHRNQWLQADFESCGEDAFEFSVIEETDDPDQRELFWIDQNRDNCYNFRDWQPSSRADEMPSILNRIRRRGIEAAKGSMD